LRACNCISISLLFRLVLSAQEANQGTITGFVYDQSQALIANAEITVTSQETGRARFAKSSSEGVYTMPALRSGVYNVRVSSPGFKSAEVRDVMLNVGASLRLNFNLEVGALTETVTVEATAMLLKTETGEISNTVTGTQVTEIPINGRNFTQFLALGTGVVSQQTGRQMGLGQEGNPLMGVHGGRI
jgi:hypothetical protein